ncbi:ZIP family metal transporter [Leucothrix arctica]|uniref:Divalent cation transporter n=1 Tax=Leucothrix arctica TaxID=1481894 RepID=A0A317CG67_9GAMM|nr:ZIP family metal transporter [Leucothrix arctica]PWQ97574.1 divalent cation transporter [Leucothrix arctica]
MSLLFMVIATTLFAGLAMAFGAVMAYIEEMNEKWIGEGFEHSVLAFGGGALLSAVALVLVPEGIATLSPLNVCFWFVAGGLCFMLLDIYLKKINTPATQLAAMLTDFIPESIALGAAFATGSNSAYLLAGLIALQNIPEGFSAYRELNTNATYNPRKIIITFSVMSLLGPIAGVTGYLWLDRQPDVISMIMLFAAGGILYSIFQDLAPKVRLENHWGPPMGAVLGFVLGMYGFMLTASS